MKTFIAAGALMIFGMMSLSQSLHAMNRAVRGPAHIQAPTLVEVDMTSLSQQVAALAAKGQSHKQFKTKF